VVDSGIGVGREEIDLVEQLVDQHHAEGTSPGLAYGVIAGGELVHWGGRGSRHATEPGGQPPDADTVFRIASMTKSFTAATVLLLRDEGRLRLDDDVVSFVPETAALHPPTADAPPITVRSLLTMTAGLPTDDPWGDRQQALPDDDFAALLAGGLSFAWSPGTIFEYSNLGYALLGRVISIAAQAPYRDVVCDRLLTPLGLTRTGYTEDVSAGGSLAQGYRRRTGTGDESATGWEAEASGEAGTSEKDVAGTLTDASGTDWEPEPLAPYGSFAPMGGLFSTVRDLGRWVSGLVGAFPPRDGGDDHPLSRASRRELQLPHLGLPPAITWRTLASPPLVRGVSYGFGLMVERDPHWGTLVSHSGGYPGFGSHMRWHPGTGLGVVVLGNATYAPAARLGAGLTDALVASVARDRSPALSRRPGASPAPATGSLVEASASAREGVTRLIAHWDDDLAARLLAMNVDLDEPLADRRRHWTDLVDRLGPLAPDDTEPVSSVSPAHAMWWLRGPGGRVRVEIRLDPERPPRVQALTVTEATNPSPALRRVVERITAQLAVGSPHWPDDVPVADPVDRNGCSRQLAVAAAWAGACTIGPVLAGDGIRQSTLRLDGERVALLLTVAVDPDSGALTSLDVIPDPG